MKANFLDFKSIAQYSQSQETLFAMHIVWENIVMDTNLKVVENLIQEALELGNQTTKRAVIEEALREYVQRRKQLKIMELFGTIEYDDNYDFKEQRQRM